MNLTSPHWLQGLLPLTLTITTERGHSLASIPDRATAQDDLQELRRQYRKHLAKAVIRNDRPGKSSTCTLRYFTHDTDTVRLF